MLAQCFSDGAGPPFSISRWLSRQRRGPAHRLLLFSRPIGHSHHDQRGSKEATHIKLKWRTGVEQPASYETGCLWSGTAATYLAPSTAFGARGSCKPFASVAPPTFSLRKEVIQPQVLLRLPCYDFTPIMSHTLGRCLLAVSMQTSSTTHFRDVTGGVYKARERIHGVVLIRHY
jgi:hypothetical protein